MATETIQPKVKFSANKTGNFTYNSDTDLNSVSIANGSAELTLTISGISVVVAANENYTDIFHDFRKVDITTTGTYRLILRGW